MTDFLLGLLSLPFLLLLIFFRMPIGLALFLVGSLGTILLSDGLLVVLARLKSEVYTTFSSYSLSIVPLFLLMGQFATLGGVSRSLFRATETWLGHRRGGVAIASIGACAGFGSICGSSLATAATMGRVALPELRRSGYSGGLSTATLAAGGTLGILIPPSVVLVIYAILTEQNIAKLFIAAFIPAFLAVIGYILTILILVHFFPSNIDVRPRESYLVRFRSLLSIWPVLVLFLLVVGGIYAGLFTPTEAAALGALGTFLLAYFGGGLTRSGFVDSILETASSTAMIFFILFGASFYNSFLALSGVPQEVSYFVSSGNFSPFLILFFILLLYFVFGCFLDSLSMILLTVPIFFPIISSLDFGLSPEETALWFGILVLVVVEVGLITPPVGMNLFVINSLDGSVGIVETYKWVIPFVMSDIVRTALLVLFPGITLFLFRLLY